MTRCSTFYSPELLSYEKHFPKRVQRIVYVHTREHSHTHRHAVTRASCTKTVKQSTAKRARFVAEDDELEGECGEERKKSQARELSRTRRAFNSEPTVQVRTTLTFQCLPALIDKNWLVQLVFFFVCLFFFFIRTV